MWEGPGEGETRLDKNHFTSYLFHPLPTSPIKGEESLMLLVLSKITNFLEGGTGEYSPPVIPRLACPADLSRRSLYDHHNFSEVGWRRRKLYRFCEGGTGESNENNNCFIISKIGASFYETNNVSLTPVTA